jgi:6-phosphogluconate dehydrogenase
MQLGSVVFARFSSRGNGDYTARMLAALRNQFGGPAVKAAPGGS